MDLALPILADANLHLSAAEEFLAGGERESARRQLDKAEDALNELREHYRNLDAAGQGLLAQMAKPLSERQRELARALPKRKPVSVGEPEKDSGQNEDAPLED